MGRVLAVDPGRRRIGLAISDEGGLIAQPLPSLGAEPSATLAHRLGRLAVEKGASRVVVGLPRRMDGSRGPEALAALTLADELRDASGLPVETADERLTSVQAERFLVQDGVRRARRKGVVDGVAAALILQSYLERLARGR
jgi:putative Holliday junction resolvase